MGAKVSINSGRFGVGQNADINMTPLVDVLLVLLIIFMLAMPMATVATKLNLPPSGPTAPAEKAKVVVDVEPKGHILIDSREVQLSSLGAAIRQALNTPRPEVGQIVVRAAPGVQYKGFMQVLNQMQYDGLPKVSLMTETL